MDKTLKTICRLLESPDNLRRCGAAVVLGELAPRDAGVVKALGEALRNANPTLTACVLDALEAIGSPGALPYVLPLLDAQDLATKMRAAGIAARAGARAVVPIRQQLQNAPAPQKLLLLDVLARIHTREAFQILLDVLLDPDPQLARGVCEAVHRHVRGAPPNERLALHRQTLAFLKSGRARQRERTLGAALVLLGAMGRPEARAVLLKHAGPRLPAEVRRHALMALANLEWTGAAARSVAAGLFALLDEPDAEIVRQAVEALARLPAAALSNAPWKKLLAGRQPAVRAFAARKLAETDTAANNRLLVGLLDQEDLEVREAAAKALAGREKAAGALLDALADAADAQAAWRLVKILKTGGRLDSKALAKFRARAAHDLETGNPRAEALLQLLRGTDPEAADTLALETGLRCMHAKKWTAGVECLRRLIHSPRFDEPTRYALSVCNLKVSPKELASQVRAEDYALRGFHALLRAGDPRRLLERLQKDKALDAADLYYVGFHFAEALTGPERPFGEEVLAHVAKRWPRSPEGKAARNRLKPAAQAPRPHARNVRAG